MNSDLELVSALRLSTKFLKRGIKHRRLIPNKNAVIPVVQTNHGVPSENENNIHVEIEETWDFEPGSHIGQGAFGTVMFQRRRPLMWDHTQTSHNQVRAVKEISKSGTPNYMKELQAIARFSQPQYNQFFVQTYGWFEDKDFVYITMEYLYLGDLAHFNHREGPFPEKTVGLILRQVLEGIKFMHEINFAHRDLKPANILVASTAPWKVKIADFGISKQCHEGTQLQTQVGTLEYMAPEQKGQLKGSQKKVAYSTAVDVWAIGVITMELLLTHPFMYNSDQEDYVQGINPLSFDGPPGTTISETCRNFIQGLLAPNPTDRPTAEMAISHTWFAEVAHMLKQVNTLFVPEEVDPSQRDDAVNSSPMPLLSWSTFGNLRLTDGSQRRTLGSRGTFSSRGTLNSRSTRRPRSMRGVESTPTPDPEPFDTYQGRPFQRRLLAHSFRDLPLNKVKYFVLRSDNELDMETSFAKGVWSAMKDANKRLDNAYLRSDGNVILFFSVVGSRKFCGVARMTSPMDWDTTEDDWRLRDDGREYQGQFTLDWICLNELPFEGIKTVPAYLGTQRRAIAVMDGTAICPESGYEILRAYSIKDKQSPCMIERQEY